MKINLKYSYKFQILLIVVCLICQLILLQSSRADEVKRSLSIIAADDIVIGSKDAPVVMIEYFAPTCTHCNDFHQEIFPTLKEKYIDTGKIAYVMREFVGNKQDLDASILARCSVDNESYLKLMATILRNQENWAYGKNYRQELTDIGINSGVSKDQYVDCLADDAPVKIFVQNAQLASATSSFVGTPSFFINGEIISSGFSTKEEFLKIIEQKVESSSLHNDSVALSEQAGREYPIWGGPVIIKAAVDYLEETRTALNALALN